MRNVIDRPSFSPRIRARQPYQESRRSLVLQRVAGGMQEVEGGAEVLEYPSSFARTPTRHPCLGWRRNPLQPEQRVGVGMERLRRHWPRHHFHLIPPLALSWGSRPGRHSPDRLPSPEHQVDQRI